MNPITDITAEDLLPLVSKLSRDERLRLSRLAILLGGGDAATDDAAMCRAAPSAMKPLVDLTDKDAVFAALEKGTSPSREAKRR